MELKPCPFCGSMPKREIRNDILNITCNECVSIGFHNHVNYGTIADTEWNTRAIDPLLKEMAEVLKWISEDGHAMASMTIGSRKRLVNILQKYHEQED